MKDMRALDAIATRRSVRRFAPREVPRDLVPKLIAAACAAPAPHHDRPWRFAEVNPETRPRLIEAMAAAWRADLESDRRPREPLDKLLARSRRQLTEAPLLLLACLELGSARDWPDERRRAAERDMYVQSLGAALQNLLLAAHAYGRSCLRPRRLSEGRTAFLPVGGRGSAGPATWLATRLPRSPRLPRREFDACTPACRSRR